MAMHFCNQMQAIILLLKPFEKSMLIYPHLNPIALNLGPLKVHWYGLMYALGFLSAWMLATLRAKRPHSGWTADQVSDLIFYGAMGVILGGRTGYILFYDFSNFLAEPLIIFKLWQGGMSFHGGLLGVLLAFGLFAYRTKKTFFEVADFTAPLVPVGLAAGRIGNFINGELWGRVTDVPWAMVFPNAGSLPRHPSQIYEFLLEGVVLFLILWIYSAKPKPRMAVSGLFLLMYGIFRVSLEFFRQPDAPLGFVAFGWLTMGQLLSLPMILLGLIFMWRAYILR
jgi:phosphatidylglycerol:prolipoprotein diacylglycerol transferase